MAGNHGPGQAALVFGPSPGLGQQPGQPSIREISGLVSTNDLRVDAKSGKKPDGSRQMSLGEIMETEDPTRKASRLLEEIRSQVVETAGDVKVQEVNYELFK